MSDSLYEPWPSIREGHKGNVFAQLVERLPYKYLVSKNVDAATSTMQVFNMVFTNVSLTDQRYRIFLTRLLISRKFAYFSNQKKFPQ